MSVYRRGKTWYINLTINKERIHRAVADNEADARQIQDILRKEARELRIKRKRSVPFTRVASEFLSHVKATLSPRTYDLYKTDYEVHVKPFFALSFIDAVNNQMLLSFQKRQKGKKLANRTVNIHMGLVSKIINFAIDNGYLENPKLKFPMLREPKRIHAYFTPVEWTALTDKLSNSLTGKRIRFGRLTGMRPKELSFLAWSDIDISLRQLKVKSKPKQGFQIKTDEERIIPLCQEAVKILGTIYKISPWVFSTTKKPVLDIRKFLKTVARKAGIKKSVTMGMLRHTFASELLMKGADILTVMELMGHKNIETTYRYLHSIKAQQRDAVELLSE